MKTKNLFIIAILFLFVTSVSAQGVKHSLGGWLGGGYTSFMHEIGYYDTYINSVFIPDYNRQTYGSEVRGGAGGFGGLGYELNAGWFLLQAGAEFSYLTSLTRFEDLYLERDWLYTAPDDVQARMFWKYDFEKYYTDKQQAGFVQIPLLVGAKIGRFYGLAGVKYGINVLGSYTAENGKYATAMQDEQLIGKLDDPQIPHYLVNGRAIETGRGTTGMLKFSQNLVVSAEVGVTLDEWIYPKPRRRRNSTRTIPTPPRPTFRVALFADYGLFNLIKDNKTDKHLIDYYQTSYIADTLGTVLSHVATPLDLGVNQLFSTTSAKGQNVNSLMAGVKLTIMMPIAEQVKRKPRARLKRTPRERPARPAPKPTVFYARVVDAETNQPLEANYQMIDVKSKKELFGGITDASNGFIENPLKTGNYSFLVNRDGYIYYTGSVTKVTDDTLTVALQPVKKEVKVVLQDIFFDIDKWVIKSASNIALEDLHSFLTDNPDVKIHIVCHTDNTGTLRHNMTLSDNRAKAVVEWLLKAGIDEDRLTYEGKGPDEPIDTNDTLEGRSKNRRVEFIVQ
jgi:outer membrane protein OmpA-like peptidoglycan-associated protein